MASTAKIEAGTATSYQYFNLPAPLSGNASQMRDQLANARRNDPAWPQRPWDKFGIEEQASVVDDWYGENYAEVNGTAASNDPAFPFIRDHVRAGSD
jgi:hypothetical protein